MRLKMRKGGIDMKVYKTSHHVAIDHNNNTNNQFNQWIKEIIEDSQNKGYQVEIQYSTCADSHTVVYSALILGYTEE